MKIIELDQPPTDAPAQRGPKIVELSPPQPVGAANEFMKGATLGWSDEIQAIIAATVAKLGQGAPQARLGITPQTPLVATPEPSFPQLYGEASESFRDDSRKFTEENPGTAVASNVAGALVTGKAPLGLLEKAGVAMQGVRGVATAGTAIGATAGAGVADEGETLKGAAEGAVTGLAAGFLVSSIGAGFSSAFKRFAPGVQNRLRAIADESGLTPSQIQTRLTALGPKATLADVADVFRRTADVAASRLGPTAMKVKALIRRDETQFSRLMEPIRRTLGDTGSAVKTVSQLKDLRMTQSSPLYEKAFNAGIQPTNRLTDLLGRPEVQRAWRKVQSFGKSDPDIDVALFGKGTTPSFRGWQAITEHLSDRVSTLTRTGSNNGSNIIGRLRKSIMDELDAQSDDFRQARALWAGTKQADDMLEAGAKFLKQSPSEIKDAWRSMSDADKAFYRMGVGRSIEERLATANDTTDLGRMFRNEAFRDKVYTVFPDKTSAVDFINTVKAETIKKSTTNAVGRGSQTQPRLVVEKQLGGGSIGAEDVTKTGVVNRALNALNIGGAREKTMQELGDLLLSQNPADQARAIRMMGATRQGNALRTGPIGAGVSNLTGQTKTR
jgi:hypothetical protein